jgi:poly(3-hydroxybutyrate) depolymerase
MAAAGDDPARPRSMTLMGGPIDTRRSADVEVNRYAMTRSLRWFDTHVITRVPLKYPGYMRRVYPGFLQHIRLRRHEPRPPPAGAPRLLQPAGGGRWRIRRRASQVLRRVQRRDGPAGRVLPGDPGNGVHEAPAAARRDEHRRHQRVRPWAIRDGALFTIEGELDDISGPGQTEAAHELCRNIPAEKKRHYPGAGRRPLRHLQRPALARDDLSRA